MSHPNLPTCDDCKKWVHDKDWKRSERRGLPILRGPNDPTPCQVCPKIPRGAAPIPDNAVSLLAKNTEAYWYYHQCQADQTAILPRDRIVVRNNALIKLVLESQDRGARDSVNSLLLALAGFRR